MASTKELDRALDVAKEAVAAGGAAALPWHRREVPRDTKPDRSPVTKADHASDAAILEVIRGAYPDHDILSEESGTLGPGACDCRWIVDPLDGTRGFIRGDEEWGPMVALEHEGELVVAALALPALGRTYWARRGGAAWRDGERVQVSGVERWDDATLVIGFYRALMRDPAAEAIESLMRSVDRVRCPGDLASCVALIEGRADAWFEAGVREWDLAAPRLLIEEAGGRFTDLLGRPTHAMGNALATNGRLHSDLLIALRR